jgi:drug/metabolite transporter (DMT)-like permease
MKHTVSIIIISLIVIGVMLLLFFVAVPEHDAINWVSLVFMVLSVVVAAGGYITIRNYAKKMSAMMLITGGYSTLVIYFIISVIISAVFMSGTWGSVKVLITIQLILLAIASIIMIALINVNKYANAQDEKSLEQRDSHTPKRGGI